MRLTCDTRGGMFGSCPTDKHRDVESRFRELLTDATLPTPDDVGYEPESIVFYWHGPRVAVCVDFDQDPLDALELTAR